MSWRAEDRARWESSSACHTRHSSKCIVQRRGAAPNECGAAFTSSAPARSGATADLVESRSAAARIRRVGRPTLAHDDETVALDSRPPDDLCRCENLEPLMRCALSFSRSADIRIVEDRVQRHRRILQRDCGLGVSRSVLGVPGRRCCVIVRRPRTLRSRSGDGECHPSSWIVLRFDPDQSISSACSRHYAAVSC